MTTGIESHDELRAWAGDLAGGDVVRFERAVARREAWIVDVDRDGAVQQCFLRLGHEGDVANSPASVAREAEIVRMLGVSGIRVPEVFGVHAELHAALYERVRGSSDLEHAEPAHQQVVYRDYIRHLAALHRVDLDTLDLAGYARPATAEECALTELDVVEQAYGGLFVEPLATFGVQWLRRHVPHAVDRIALVHGDAGTPNFMFDGNEVSALIDWEWAHLGDPMEDLGNALIHASFHTSGDWPELLDLYERESGIPVDRDRVRYYRAHLMVRSVIALAAITASWNSHDPVALNLCFRITSDRICCDSIAAAMGVELERPALPVVAEPATTLYDIVAENLREDVRPATSGEFPVDRLDSAVLLVQSLERVHRIGPALEQVELDELAALLGERPPTLVDGLATLDRELRGFGPEREVEVLRYLGRRAWRTEQLYAPVVSLFANRELRPLG